MITPINYKIHLEPDICNFTFDGHVEIEIQSQQAVHEIVLNSRDLDFHSCIVERDNRFLECTFSPDASNQQALITIPERIQGSFRLFISYSGEINNRYAGLYRSRYEHQGRQKFIISTQFEASDARRAFPCFDQPDKKATFEIEYVIDDALTGIANTAIIEERHLGDGKKMVRFEPTPKMSTYLVFFGIGEFEFIEDRSEPPLIRVATTPGKTQYAQYALDIARKSLKFGEDFTGIPYPLSKCDYIAIPDSLGAMENFGAIRHSEDVLLVYPGETPKFRQTLIAKIIAHEGIHMWFGDLVSPAAWKYLWLNEAFATYFTYVIPHHYFPEWGVWEQFFPERMLSGLERDGLTGSPSINLPDSDDPNADPAPTPSTAPIVYNKGAAVMRMLAAYLGEELFQQGVRAFLSQYQFEAATSDQFWEAVEQSTGKPVDIFAQTWVNQPGYPLVQVDRDAQALILTQSRFCYSSPCSEGTWFIPIDILLVREGGNTESIQAVLIDRQLRVPLPPDLVGYKLNAGFTGFFRVNYPAKDWETLGKLSASGELSAIDALNILNDRYALVKSGVVPIPVYLQFVAAYFRREDRYLPLIEIAKKLLHLYLVADELRDEVGHLGVEIFEHTLGKIGLEPEEDEPLLTTELRDILLWSGFILGAVEISAFGAIKFQSLKDGEPVHQNLLSIVLKIGAAMDHQALGYLIERAADPGTPEADKIMTLEALGNLSDQDQLLQALETNLEDVPSSLRSHMVSATAQNPVARQFMWQWFEANLHRLEALPLGQVERIIVNIVPICGIGYQDEVVGRLSDFVDRFPRAKDSVQMALELLAINERLRRI
jgi:tricorn protease interacting factor F2/3